MHPSIAPEKITPEKINITLTVSNPIRRHLSSSYKEMKDEFDRNVFKYCLNRYKNNFVRVSAELGINRNTLRKRMKELGINDEYIRQIKTSHIRL